MTNGGINFAVKDNAGNSADYTLFQMVVDEVAPELTFSDISNLNLERAENDETVYVNGTITLTGTASDNQKMASLKVEYKKNGSSTWEEIPATTNTSLTSWSRTLDTTVLDDETEYEIRVSATDTAGNTTGTSSITKTIKVSQDTDRPIITVTNPSSIENLSTTSVKWESREISGTVSDDDPISYIGYYVGNEISYTDSVYTSLRISNGIWKFKLEDDGSQNVFFKVTAGGKNYYANTSTTYNTATIYDSENNRGTYKLTDSTNNFGYRLGTASEYTTTKNILALIVDTIAPDVETAEFSLDDGSTWQTGLGSLTFGGTKRNNIKVRQNAWDKNDAKSMSVKVIKVINGQDSETPIYTHDYDSYSEVDKSNGKTYRQFTTADMIVTDGWTSTTKSNSGSTEYRLEISISDGIKTTVSKFDFVVDNTPPEVNFSSPDSSGTHSGEISVNGSSTELGNFYYTVSTYGDSAHKPSLDAGKILSGWTGWIVAEDGTKTNTSGTIGNVGVPVYKPIPNTTLSWGVHFDGNLTDTQRAHAELLKNYIQSLGITDNLNSFAKLVNLYVWIKAEDAVGNTGEYPHLVCIDPQGDRPSISISAPENPGDSLGGTIKLLGSAEDSNGSVESVWVQLLSEKNGGADAGYGPVDVDGTNINSFEPTTSDLDFWKTNGFTVAKMKPEEDGSHTEWTGTITNPGSLSGNDSASDYGIRAVFTGTTSWNLKINRNQEFNTEGNDGVNQMAMRVYACDNDKNLSYPVTRYFIIDKGAPVISDVMLRQYAESDTSFATPLASQEVRAGLYVKGKWYLEFTATDDHKLASIAFTDENNNEENIASANITTVSDSEWKVRYALATNQGVGIFKRTIKALDDIEHPGTFDIEINYDNEAPKLLENSSTDFDIAAAVRQNNGFYKLSSKVNDTTSASVGTPSGIKAVGFYFMRRKSADEGLIYDPMQKRAEPISTNDLIYADGLYWFEGTVSINNEGIITIGTGLSEKAAYIHAGSYIRLGGVMYKISTLSGNTIRIDESIDTSFTTAQIALAQFVDNRKAEYEANTNKDSTTGYYTSIKNDDGDGMIEELGGTNTVSSWQASIVSRNIPDGPIEIHYTAYDESLNYAVGIVGNTDIDTYKNYTTDEVDELWNKDSSGTRTTLKTASTSDHYSSYVYTYNSESPAYISNNAPRLAGVTVKIDYIGTGSYQTATPSTYYFNESPVLIDGIAVKKPITVTNSYDIYDAEKDDAGNITGYKAINTIKGKTWIIPEMIGGNGKLWYSYNIYDSNDDGSKNNSVKKKDGGTNAIYFADGRDDFDEYEEKAAGQTYIVSHNTSKLGDNDERTESYIEHDASLFTETGDTTSLSRPFWFDYVIYDSTENEPESETGSAAITALENNQKAKISIAMAVDVNDIVPPTVVFDDLYWKSASENSVYWEGGKPKGHVELIRDIGSTKLGTDYGTDDDKVSGIVKFTGYAYDNKCLKELKWAIVSNPANDSYETLSYLFGSGMQSGATFNTDSGEWVPSDATLESNHYTFAVSKEEKDGAYHDQNGHKVKWTLTVDTSHIDGVVGTDLRVIVQAKDNASTPKASELTNTSTATSRPTYKIDVVPYITGINTQLNSLKKNNPSVYNRTALGHYPISSSETITFTGFNLSGLNGETPIVANYQKVAPVAATEGVEEVSEVTVPLSANGELDASNITKSGEVVLKVGDLYTINNMNNNQAYGTAYETAPAVDATGTVYKDKNFYNRQPNGDNNNLLTDDVIVDVWQITPQAAKPKSGYATQPVMAINPSSHDVGFAFVNSTLYYSMPNGTTNSYKTWIGGYDFWTSVGLAYDSAGHAYGTAAGGDIADNRADTFRIMTSRWGTSDTSVNGYNNGKNNYRLEFIAQADYDSTGDNCTRNFNKERVRSPSLATAGATADRATVYLAYYDEINDEIRFKWGTFTNTTQKDWYTNRKTDEQKAKFFGDYYGENSGDYKSESNGKNTLEGHNGDYRLTHNSLIAGQTTNKYTKAKSDGDVGTTTNAYSMTTAVMTNETDEDENPVHNPVYAGKYVSIAAIENGGTSDDAIVAVWWDAEHSQLLYSYNLTPKSIQVGQYLQADTKWSTPVAIFGEGNGIGEYCKVAVDENNGVHVAAYDGLSGDLWYAYVSDFDTPSNANTCIVDSYGIIGSELNIDVALNESSKPVPYISYYAGSCARPKIAYFAGTDITSETSLNSADDEVFTGLWEVSVIPTSSKVSADHINVGVWKDADGKLNWSTKDGDVPASSNIGTTAPGTDDGKVYGNGSKNPILGYAITQGSNGYIETAQMK